MEDDLGVPIFDRLPTGVRLSVAGELFIHHVRRQLADMERVQSQIADLAGERRGHVSIVCGQALMNNFIPDMISRYRTVHPAVSFDVRVCNRHEVESALTDYTADIALVFEPQLFNEFHPVIDVGQPLQVVFGRDHPLQGRESVRLSECAEYPMALPTRASGVRHLLEQAAAKLSLDLPVFIESDSQLLLWHSLAEHHTVSFQIPIGLDVNDREQGHGSCPVNLRDVPEGRLYVGQLKGRNLPVASARFLEQLSGFLDDRFAISE